jgi:hypothetical protein
LDHPAIANARRADHTVRDQLCERMFRSAGEENGVVAATVHQQAAARMVTTLPAPVDHHSGHGRKPLGLDRSSDTEHVVEYINRPERFDGAATRDGTLDNDYPATEAREPQRERRTGGTAADHTDITFKQSNPARRRGA